MGEGKGKKKEHKPDEHGTQESRGYKLIKDIKATG